MKRHFRTLTVLVLLLATGLEVFAMEGTALCQASQPDLDALSGVKLIYIATVRKDGNQSTAAPVWFTVTPDRLLLIQTNSTTWKAKRIRHNCPVIVWIGKRDGPAFIGKAEITNDPMVEQRIIHDYPEKYLTARLGLHRPTQQMFDSGRIVAIRITPARDLPSGFISNPGTPPPSIEGGHTSLDSVISQNDTKVVAKLRS
jgi:general stress protein 26